jgi:hypothetical protein
VAGNGHGDQAGRRGDPLPIPQQTASTVAEPRTAGQPGREPEVEPVPAAASDEVPSGHPQPGESAAAPAAPAAAPAAPAAAPAAPAAKKQSAPAQPTAGPKATAHRDRKAAGRQAADMAAERGQPRRPGDDRKPAAGKAAGSAGAEQADDDADRAPGPLATAASMARSVAEARIKAAMRPSDQAAEQDRPAEPGPPDLPARAAARGGASRRLPSPRSGWRESAMIARKAMRRPEAASGGAPAPDSAAPTPRDSSKSAPAPVVAPATPAA